MSPFGPTKASGPGSHVHGRVLPYRTWSPRCIRRSLLSPGLDGKPFPLHCLEICGWGQKSRSKRAHTPLNTKHIARELSRASAEETPAERVTRFRFRGTEPALSARGTLEGEKRLPAGSGGLPGGGRGKAQAVLKVGEIQGVRIRSWQRPP